MPKFSIISPVYNTSAYIGEFIESVLQQNFADFELILVDDGSTDNSLEICKKYSSNDSRIIVLTQKNSGAGPARNNGIKNSRGEYLIFWDSDDWVEHNALQFLNSVVDDSEADLYIYGAKELRFNKKGCIYEEISIFNKKTHLTSQTDCRNEFCNLIFNSVMNPPWNKVYKKQIIEENNIVFPPVKRGQDAFFNMEYYRHIKSLICLDDEIYYYRMNQIENLWKKLPIETYKTDILYDKFLVDICNEFGIYSGKNRELVDNLFFNSLLRTASLCRNPKFKMGLFKKLKYIKSIMGDNYNQNRAKTAFVAKGSKTEKIQSRIISNSAFGILYDIYSTLIFDNIYACYCRTLRKLIKGNDK